eukprot:CAMPEP_0119340934 /NCGR_PEP_ID=MMETSP1333-20130426/101308_1 /TAXON_ID=418940 /ORGANISM="Scyphosphaera apsteinii, Strain RCC1455" /LENGTH=239 /DNA_ID=CAMNT_0007352799 /DNA_START=42 /DNA_END=761 /DNA_ORIENTATION=+
MLKLMLILEQPTRRWRTRAQAVSFTPGRRRAAAIALIKLSSKLCKPLSERMQAAAARGLALALPKRLATPRLVPGLLSTAECTLLLGEAEAYGQVHGWGSLHRKYPTVDLSVAKLPCGESINQLMKERALPAFSHLFGAEYGPPGQLRFRDLFVAKYEAHEQAGLSGHVDASFLSLVMQLNSPDEFEGGGTYFEHSDMLLRPEQGNAAFFLGKVFHEGRCITRGRRFVLVALIDRAGHG